MASHAAFSDTFSMPFQSPHSLVPTWLPSYARYCLLTLSIHSQSLSEFFITGSGNYISQIPLLPGSRCDPVSYKYTHAGFGREKGSWSCSSSYTIVTDGIRLGFLPAILYSTVQSKTMYQLWYWQWFHTVPNHCEETASPNLWVAAVVTWCKHCTTTPYFISIPSSNFVST